MPSIAIRKRVSLDGIADGWDKCFAIVSLANYDEGQEFIALTKDDKATDEDRYNFQIELVKKHFVSGQVLTTLDDGTEGLGELTVDDANAYMPISNRLFFAIIGAAPDPKGLSTPTAVSSTNEPTSSTSDTKTS